MYAVFQSGGKQHRVSVGDTLKLEKLEVEVGSSINFDQVYMVGGEGEAKIGQPVVAGASVEAEVIGQGRHRKVIVFKRRRRTGFRKKNGHRQPFTEIKITGVKA